MPDAGSPLLQVAIHGPGELFGYTFGVDSDVLVVGALSAPDAGGTANGGAAYFYTVIPEPSTVMMILLGFVIGAMRRRK